MFIVKCDSCGFVLYSGEEPRTIDAVLRSWGGVCPKCLSPLERRPIRIALAMKR